MIRLYLTLLCCFWIRLSTAQVAVLDSLQERLKVQSQPDSNRVNILNALSDQYQWLDFDRSFQYAEEALKLAEALSFQKGIATACSWQAQAYWFLGDNEHSMEKALRAVSVAEKEGLTNVLAETYRVMAMSYRDQLALEKATSYIRQAEKLAVKNNNWYLLARIYNVAGVIEHSREKDDSAMFYYNKSLQITDDHPIRRIHLSQVVSNMGAIYLAEDPDKGLEYFVKALASARETHNRPAEAGITADIGGAYMLKKNYKEADRWLNESLKLSRGLGLKRINKFAYYTLATLKISEGKTDEAFRYMTAYHDVRDSLFSVSQTRQIVELETRFEKEKQEQRIQLLEQERQIERLWRNALLVGLSLLLIAVTVIYRLQKLRSEKARQLLETQRTLNEQLRETDLLKSRFFANISHEFRTPLSLILAPLDQQLRNENLSPIERKNLKLTQRNANRLLDLVNQLLDLSRLEAGKMELSIRRGNLSAFLQLLTASFDSLAEHKQIAFGKNISSIDKPIGYDEDKVEKIVTNILFNAFKFTPPGGQVVFSMHVANEDREILISVADTGRGIPPDEQASVFSPFYQLKNDSEDGRPGTGLGLSLVNELVKLYGGTVKLMSEVNKGTCITVTLPVLESDVVEEASPRAIDIDKKFLPSPIEESQGLFVSPEVADTILVLEDNAELRNFIASGFANRFVVLTATNGDEGLVIAKDRIPDVIISDVMMPKMNGIEFTNSIRQDERTCHIPIILLTAKADDQSRIAGLKTGADEYLAKPFSMEELQIRVNNLLEQRRRLAARLKEDLTIADEHSTEPVELSLDEKFVLKVKSTIENNIGNSMFSVEMLAEEVNLSRAHLFRKVKALLNTSPSEFINDIRLDRAAQLIKAKADNVSQIGYAVGFNEQSYFSKRFRKKYGVSPTEYAQKWVTQPFYQ